MYPTANVTVWETMGMGESIFYLATSCTFNFWGISLSEIFLLTELGFVNKLTSFLSQKEF